MWVVGKCFGPKNLWTKNGFEHTIFISSHSHSGSAVDLPAFLMAIQAFLVAGLQTPVP